MESGGYFGSSHISKKDTHGTITGFYMKTPYHIYEKQTKSLFFFQVALIRAVIADVVGVLMSMKMWQQVEGQLVG